MSVQAHEQVLASNDRLNSFAQSHSNTSHLHEQSSGWKVGYSGGHVIMLFGQPHEQSAGLKSGNAGSVHFV